jgi:multidrug efflux system membrane fusion protein
LLFLAELTMHYLAPAVRHAGVVIALSTLLGACGQDAPPPPKPPEVEVAAALAREVNDWDEFTGRLVAIESVQVRPQVTGTIEQIAFEDGRYVKKGDLLFRLDDRVPKASLERAQAELAAARAARSSRETAFAASRWSARVSSSRASAARLRAAASSAWARSSAAFGTLSSRRNSRSPFFT